MKTAQTLLMLGASLSIATTAWAQARPDFSGRWKLDSIVVMGGGRGDASGNASGGGGAGGGGTGLGPPAQELTIRQNDSTLTIEESGNGDDAVGIVLRLDGKKVRNTMRIGRGRTTEATYVSRWNGSTVASTIVRTVSARGGNVRIEYRESRYVSSDGILVVETAMVGRPAGRKALYRRSDSSPARPPRDTSARSSSSNNKGEICSSACEP